MSGKRSKNKSNSSYVWAAACIVAVSALTLAIITVIMSQIFSNKEDVLPPIITTISTGGNSAGNITTPGTASGNDPITTPKTTTGAPPATTPGTTAPATTPEPEPTAPPVTTKKPTTTPATTPAVGGKKDPEPSGPYGFVSDLSEFERFMDPTGEYWDDAYLTLVNVNNRLADGEEDTFSILKPRMTFKNSKDYKYTNYTSLYMNEYAMKALSAMFLEAAANGIKGLDVQSAYRSYSRQETIFKSNCDKTYKWECTRDGSVWIGKSSVCPECGKSSSKKTKEGLTLEEIEANVATYSCAPGTSDHQTGLAVDIVQTTLDSSYVLTQKFANTEAGKWLLENSWKFGFVLRFPPDKQDITGIIYEPWHYRFVGRTHAAKMKELNMCLEEYVEYLNETGYFD